jgi:WD40 repeat protein
MKFIEFVEANNKFLESFTDSKNKELLNYLIEENYLATESNNNTHFIWDYNSMEIMLYNNSNKMISHNNQLLAEQDFQNGHLLFAVFEGDFIGEAKDGKISCLDGYSFKIKHFCADNFYKFLDGLFQANILLYSEFLGDQFSNSTKLEKASNCSKFCSEVDSLKAFEFFNLLLGIENL